MRILRGSMTTVLLNLLLLSVLLFPSLGLSAAPPDPLLPSSQSLRVRTPQYVLGPDGINVPGYALNDVPGAPRLPVYSTLVELPLQGEWELSYRSTNDRILDQRVAVPAAPVPDPSFVISDVWTDLQDVPTTVPTVDRPDPSIYGVDALYPVSPVQTGTVVRQGAKRLLPVHVYPFQFNPITQEVLYHPDVQVTLSLAARPERSPAATTAPVDPSWCQPYNPLGDATGAVRVHTLNRGMHRLTYSDLQNAGVPVGPGLSDPATFAMSYMGEPIHIQMVGAQDGSFDPGDHVVFYAEPYGGSLGYTPRYQKHNVYWFTYGGTPSPAMDQRAAPQAGQPVQNIITQTLRSESDLFYAVGSETRRKDEDHWLDVRLSVDEVAGVLVDSKSYPMALDDYLTSGNVVVRARLHRQNQQASFNPDNSAAVYLNDHYLGTYQWNGETDVEVWVEEVRPASWLDGAPNEIVVEVALDQLPGIEWYRIRPDWVELSYPALADAEDDRIYIEDVESAPSEIQVSGFSTGNVRVYDVRDPWHPVELTTKQAVPDGPTYTVSFWDTDSTDPSYYLSSQASLRPPLLVQADVASNLAAPSNHYDYIAIVPSELEHGSLATDIAAEIQPLLDHRELEGLRTLRVSVQDVYDEFSYGLHDPEAIRCFLKYAHENWNQGEETPPEYALLVGDGHYDFTGITNTTNPNLIDPYLLRVDPYRGEVPVDNRFVSFDSPEDALPNMAIGRLPINSVADVTKVVQKILSYEDPALALPGDWQKRAVFAAGLCNDDAGDFHAYSDDIRNDYLPAEYDTPTVYVGNPAICPGAGYPDDSSGAARVAVQEHFNAGAVYLQYFGHGAENRWGSAFQLTRSSIDELLPNTTWPFVGEYGCLTGYYVWLSYDGGLDAHNNQALAEDFISRHGDRGAVADWAASGLHVASALNILNQGLAQAIFQDRIDRAGKAVNEAKLYYYANPIFGSYPDVIDSTVYFGDPALKLRLPQIPRPPQVAATRIGNAIELAWGHITWDVEDKPITVTHYEIWRDTIPYFLPGEGSSQQIATIVPPGGATEGTPLSVIDDGGGSGVIGDVNTNYYYLVKAVSDMGFGSDNSSRAGEFDFGVAPGS